MEGLNHDQAYAKKNTELAKKRELVDMAVEIDKRTRKQFILSNKIEEKFIDQVQPGKKIYNQISSELRDQRK